MSFTTKVVSLNPDHASCTRYQYYAIKFVSDLRQVGGFLRVLRIPRPIHTIRGGFRGGVRGVPPPKIRKAYIIQP